jgi:DNA-binding LytR/AlgR family response regulator
MTLQTFKHIEEILPKEDFIRIHRSYIVALDKIDSIERNRVKIGEELLPISDSYKDGFFEVLGNKGIV